MESDLDPPPCSRKWLILVGRFTGDNDVSRGNLVIPLDPPLEKGEDFIPPFGKWFDRFTILSLPKEGGWEGFKGVIF